MAPKAAAEAKPAATSRGGRGGSGGLGLKLAVSAALSAVLIGVLLKAPLQPEVSTQTATSVKLSDGRNLSYLEYGEPDSQYTLLYLHGAASSRLEGMLFDPEVLRRNSMRVISPDRPGFGESTPHPSRNLTTFVGDMEELAGQLGLQRVLVAARGAAAPYAAALVAESPDRVQGLAFLSPAVSPADLVAEDAAGLQGGAVYLGKATLMQSLLGKAAGSAMGAAAVLQFAQAPVAGRLLWHLQLAGPSKDVTNSLHPADLACQSSYRLTTLRAVSEGLRSKSAAAWAEDLSAVAQPLPYNLTAVSPELQARMTILASVNDTTEPAMYAQSLSRRLPGAKLELVQGEGHTAWWSCDMAVQTRLLSGLIAASCRDISAASDCNGWASIGECSKSPGFMLTNCAESCQTCHYTPQGIAAVVARPCTDDNDSCASWASLGECDANPGFMRRNCRRSCSACHRLD